MDSFPISCQNCFSHKREFYVFLECKHFLCLSCSLCLADFQNLTVRCCYRNTKMSEELASVMFEEVNKRKTLKQSQVINEESMIKELSQLQLQKKLSNQSLALKTQKSHDKSRSASSSIIKMDESQIVHTFKMIDDKIYQDIIKQSSRMRPSEIPNWNSVQLQDPCLALKSPISSFEDSSQAQCPTFKRISERPEVEHKGSSKREQTKQNYICWKNYDSSKDRILAKLNYHQQKMSNALRQHYNC